MTRRVHVELGDRSYDITIGHKLPAGRAIKRPSGLKALIISDTNVGPVYGPRYAAAMKARGMNAVRIDVPAGEASKSWSQVLSLLEKAATLRLDRSSCVVALGGGVVGDLAGFVAATYLRGIPFIQVPTSLLAMVDSSVGGKTGVNLEQGKNLVGAFYQPMEVIADLSTLKTLPDREYTSGLAEVVKYGIIRDAGLFKLLERNIGGLLRRDDVLLGEVVARCCEIKAEVVAGDEREEKGLRAILNFGHTLGHAVENAAGYGTLLHGEAVSVGMVFALLLSAKEQGLSRQACQRAIALLSRLKLPLVVSHRQASWTRVRKSMGADKKTVGGRPRFVLVERIGSAIIGCEVEEQLLKATFSEVSCRE